LPIESVEAFENSFTMLKSKLDAQKIHPAYTMESDGSENIPLLFLLLLLCTFILFLTTAINVLKNRFETAIDKLIWFLVVLLPLIGPILYIFIGWKQKLAKG
jgi:hypothetical protein